MQVDEDEGGPAEVCVGENWTYWSLWGSAGNTGQDSRSSPGLSCSLSLPVHLIVSITLFMWDTCHCHRFPK